jgi:dTDP-6-deoxy-L-talose 4-dehydrogenase (NAD+)
MKIAVTGATGFIGRYIVDELVNQENIEIFAISRKQTNNNYKKDKINWISLDINHPPDNLFEVIGSPDIVIHLAWEGLNDYKSLHHFESELPTHYNFLKRLIDDGLKNLIVTGTCLEYGMQSGALSANLNTQPVTPYGYAKDALRRQLQFLQSKYDYNLTWARLFYIYGIDQPSGSLFPQLLEAVKTKRKKFNMSGGEQLRDYLPVKEVARQLAVLAMMKRNRGLLNICSGEPQSVRSLVEKWIEENNWEVGLNLGFFPYTNYEPMEFWGVK